METTPSQQYIDQYERNIALPSFDIVRAMVLKQGVEIALYRFEQTKREEETP